LTQPPGSIPLRRREHRSGGGRRRAAARSAASNDRGRQQHHLEPRGTIEVKGKGEMKTYVLIGARASLRPPAKA